LAVPLYVAVIVLLPAGSELVVTLALPPLNVIVPRFVAPAVKVHHPGRQSGHHDQDHRSGDYTNY
ncbi:MAG: hypothetical protein WAQ52_14640, partial [Terriglobales bacterium]